jgi:succinate dehydrogenase / fumarate reductase flavoprotein subunit
VRASGVVTYELATGEIHVFRAKSVVFASGGFGKIFKTTSNAHTLTGDGPAMAFRRGIPLEDMEFFQFHPTGLAGLGILLSEAARGEGGILRNSEMERFMERYAPTLKDLAPRDVVARAMANEVREGRGAGPNKDYVYLDLTHLEPAHIDAKLPDITEFARTYLGVEPYTEPVPVFPTAHYGMGGIPTNIRGEVLANATDVIPGLYAAGETACVSVHGGNRLGTNSLLDINVFGRRAGIAAAEHAAEVDLPELPDGVETPTVELLERLRDRPATEDRIANIRADLQELMDANVQVFRTEETCRTALAGIKELKTRYETVAIQDKGRRYNLDLMEAVELGFLLDLAEIVALGALNRKESRGGHFREDYEKRDDVNYLEHTMAYRTLPGEEGAEGTPIRLGTKPVVITRYEPKERTF